MEISYPKILRVVASQHKVVVVEIDPAVFSVGDRVTWDLRYGQEFCITNKEGNVYTLELLFPTPDATINYKYICPGIQLMLIGRITGEFEKDEVGVYPHNPNWEVVGENKQTLGKNRHHRFPDELPFTQMSFTEKLRDIFGELYYRTEGKNRCVKLGLDEEAFRNLQKFLQEDYLKSGMMIYDDKILEQDITSYEFRRSVQEKGRFDVYLIDNNNTNE